MSPPRAPRLAPDQLLAPLMTRRGRFRRLDPARGRPLPPLSRWLGVLGWAVLVEEAFRRAWRAASEPSD